MDYDEFALKLEEIYITADHALDNGRPEAMRAALQEILSEAWSPELDLIGPDPDPASADRGSPSR